MTALAHQVAKPAALDLPEVATLAGKTFRGARARVYWLFVRTAQQGLAWPVGRHMGPPGWIPTWVIREPWAGSSDGFRRLSELRQQFGFQVDRQPFIGPDSGEKTSTWLYRLAENAPAQPKPRGIDPVTPRSQALEGYTYQTAPHWLAAMPATFNLLGQGHLAAPPEAKSLPADQAAVAYRQRLLALYKAGELEIRLAQLDGVVFIGPEWATSTLARAITLGFGGQARPFEGDP